MRQVESMADRAAGVVIAECDVGSRCDLNPEVAARAAEIAPGRDDLYRRVQVTGHVDRVIRRPVVNHNDVRRLRKIEKVMQRRADLLGAIAGDHDD